MCNSINCYFKLSGKYEAVRQMLAMCVWKQHRSVLRCRQHSTSSDNVATKLTVTCAWLCTWLNKGTCPSYFLKWMDALCFAPPPTFSSLRPNRCVTFHAVIMICDFRVKLSTNVYVCSFRGRSRRRGRSPHGRAVIIIFH